MRRVLFLPLLVCVFACQDAAIVEPDADDPAIAQATSPGGTAACPLEADVVVADEGALWTAIANASPGDVIGLDGMIRTTGPIFVDTEHLTLTCATPESGLEPEAGSLFGRLLLIRAERVSIDRLVLNAEQTGIGALFGWYNEIDGYARNLSITNNTITCGPRQCMYLRGAAGSVIADNYFESHGSRTGIHMERFGPAFPIDGLRVERNTVVALEPQPEDCWWCGGIRPRDGDGVVVAHNTVLGPWLNSIATAELTEARIEHNRLDGAQWFGIGVSFNPYTWFSAVDNTFRNNQVSGAGQAGVRVNYACYNTFVGNNLQGNADDVGVQFRESAGANTLVGNQNVVIDNGERDCDGDGVPDPNIITGQGAVLHGVNLGEIISDAASSSGGSDNN